MMLTEVFGFRHTNLPLTTLQADTDVSPASVTSLSVPHIGATPNCTEGGKSFVIQHTALITP